MKAIAYIHFVVLFGLGQGYEDTTVAKYLQDNPGYSFMATLLGHTGLNNTLDSESEGPFTVFAPTDAAFNKLGAVTLQSLSQNNLTLSAVLQYHVVRQYVLIPMINKPTTQITLEGQDLAIELANGTLLLNNESRVDSSNNDILVNNGVIQPIDTVLLPPVMATLNIAQILLMDDARFKDLFLALLLADLDSVLESGDYTLFAPTDAAFAVYKDNLLSPSSPNAQAVYQEVLKYHVVPVGRRSTQLNDGQSLLTLHGTAVNITVGAGGVMVNNARVLEADILATNGIVHVIDTLLIPSDINQVLQGRK